MLLRRRPSGRADTRVRISEVTKLAEDTGRRIADCAVELINGMVLKNKGSICYRGKYEFSIYMSAASGANCRSGS